jgi:hypothetical protein
MSENSIVICGLPGSGKTTFLAALWHLVFSKELPTTLELKSISDSDKTYVNEIAARWRNAKMQDHTKLGPSRFVGMELMDRSKEPVRITFPDLSGESYQRMWEEREVDKDVAAILRARTAILLFVHCDQIRPPMWVVDVTAITRSIGLRPDLNTPVPWEPRLAPVQVKLVELLQFLRGRQLDVGPRRIAVMLSAWDKISVENRPPSRFLSEKMPLLKQYLESVDRDHESRVFGCSAQGGDYEPPPDSNIEWSKEGVDALKRIDQPSKRIRLVTDVGESHDLTEPLAWLMG